MAIDVLCSLLHTNHQQITQVYLYLIYIYIARIIRWPRRVFLIPVVSHFEYTSINGLVMRVQA